MSYSQAGGQSIPHIVEGGNKMIAKLMEAVFGCKHSKYSFPVTIRGAARRPQAAALTGTYVACLDCGREFPYDWQEMKVITSPERHRERLGDHHKFRSRRAGGDGRADIEHFAHGDLLALLLTDTDPQRCGIAAGGPRRPEQEAALHAYLDR